MTLETCKKQLAAAKTPEEKAFWEERIARKIARFPKYQVKEETKSKGKK